MSMIFSTSLILLLCYTQCYITLACLYVKALKEKDLETLMNRKVEKANFGMNANKLTINATKFSALVITPEAKSTT